MMEPDDRMLPLASDFASLTALRRSGSSEITQTV
jgi:hypothetical protein